MASRKGTWLNQINEPFRVDSAMSLLASFLLKADKRQDRKSTCLPDQDQDVGDGDGVASCFAWPFSCLPAKKDNGIKSSKMKRKRQIMLRDLNWISRRVCGSLCVCVCGHQNWRWPWSRCASLIASAGIEPRRDATRRDGRDERLIHASWHQFCHLIFCRISFYVVVSYFFCGLLCFLFSISFCYVLYAWHNSPPPSAYSSLHPQVFDGIHPICSLAADSRHRQSPAWALKRGIGRRCSVLCLPLRCERARPSAKCEMNLNEIFRVTVVSVKCSKTPTLWFFYYYYSATLSYWL